MTVNFELYHPIVTLFEFVILHVFNEFMVTVALMLIVEVLLVDQLDEMLVPASSLTHGTITMDG